jgi:hypothetical protein
VLCIGLQGNIRMLGVPGEDLERVQYQLDDPDEYSGETIVVVGAGDAGIENALGLAENNRVILINRVDEFPRVKQGNIDLVTAAISSGKMECRFSTSAIKVEQVEGGAKPLKFTAQTPSGVEEIPCDRMIARLGAIPPRKLVESFGIKFPNQTMEAVPQVSATYESNVPGLYIIGALGGYPLIKQAMNQGYEVVEYILGNPVAPADESLLQAKFKDFRRAKSVSEGAGARSRRTCPCSRISRRCNCASSCSTARSGDPATASSFSQGRLHELFLFDRRRRGHDRGDRTTRTRPRRTFASGAASSSGNWGCSRDAAGPARCEPAGIAC